MCLCRKGSRLVVENTTLADSGTYQCQASNAVTSTPLLSAALVVEPGESTVNLITSVQGDTRFFRVIFVHCWSWYLRQWSVDYGSMLVPHRCIFTAQFYTDGGCSMVGCPSVCPSVMLRYCDHIGWNTLKILSQSQLIILRFWLWLTATSAIGAASIHLHQLCYSEFYLNWKK